MRSLFLGVLASLSLAASGCAIETWLGNKKGGDGSQLVSHRQLSATPGLSSVTLRFESRCKNKCDVYIAASDDLNRFNYSQLKDGRLYEGVASPFTVMDLAPGTTYYFLVEDPRSPGADPALRVSASVLSELPSPSITLVEPVGHVGSGFPSGLSLGRDVNGDGFGELAVGAPQANAEGLTQSGASYLVEGSMSGPIPGGWGTFGAAAAENKGASSALIDINADGFADLVVGAPGHSGTLPRQGRVQLFLGSANGVSTVADWEYVGLAENLQLGTLVRNAGDVNGDGREDLVVYAQDSVEMFGHLYGFYWQDSGMPAAPSWTLDGETAGARLGSSIRSIGDINGDGHADLYVGVNPDSTRWASLSGAARIYFGSASGLGALAAWQKIDAEGHHFGTDAIVGDFNGDGSTDLLTQGHREDGTAVDVELQLFEGKNESFNEKAAWSMHIPLADGATIAAGDLNGDEVSDLLLSRTLLNSNTGTVELYFGLRAGGILPTPVWSAAGSASESLFGRELASADLDADTLGDVAVSDHAAAGALHFYRGQAFNGPRIKLGTLTEQVDGLVSLPEIAVTNTLVSCEVQWGDGTGEYLDVCTTKRLARLEHTYGHGTYALRVIVRTSRSTESMALAILHL